jgi:hypothetical protein
MKSKWWIALAAAALLVPAGCGGDDDEDEGAAKAQIVAITLGADGKLQGVKQLSGGVVTTRFTNQAGRPYDMQLARVDGNQTVQQVLKVTAGEGGTIPNWLHGAGGVGTTAPGQTSSATQALPAGRYYVISSPDGEGRDITASFQVEGGEAAGTLPTTKAKIDATEYTFRASGLRAGSQQVTFDNSGRELHHVQAFPLRPGVTLAQARQFFQSEEGQEGRPPFEEQGIQGTVVLDGGVSQTVQWNLRAGKYALVCFIPDRAGGPPHVAKGMITEVNVPS